jgi:hypothetical protein
MYGHISPLGLMCLQGEEMKKETKIDVAINSPNNIDPLLQTGCFSSVVSSSTNTIAPVPHGPGLLRHEPSVNAIAVFSVVSVRNY